MSQSSVPLELKDAEAVLHGANGDVSYELRLVEDEGKIILELVAIDDRNRHTHCPLLELDDIRALIDDLGTMLRRVGRKP